uniref:F-box domain-containing protein n=1 Tax=Panagrellus redivivus TaxID=6233 RepID=A0A7E4VNK4_PANRE
MSSVSTDSALQRFTYDWLVRFAELHPMKLTDIKDIEKFYDIDGRIETHPLKPYNPNHSKYAAISPLFTTVIGRYMPSLFYGGLVYVKNGTIQKCSLSTVNKCNIMIGSLVKFTDALPGMITWFKNNRVFFYGESLLIMKKTVGSNITFDELKYLLKCCKFGNFNKNIELYATLTVPLLFSELWPHLKRCEVLRLYIDNVVYGENMAQVLRKNRSIPRDMRLDGVDVSDNVLLEIIDYFVSLPVRPTAYEFNFRHQKPVSLGEAIYDKYVSVGHSKEFYVAAARPFQTMAVREFHRKVQCSFFNELVWYA